MAKLQSRQELVDYCLRNLGGGVVNIEISPDQLTDRIDEALGFFIERHHLGVEEAILYHTLSYKDLKDNTTTIPDSFQNITEVYHPGADSNDLNESGVAAWDSLEYQINDVYNGQLGQGNSTEMASYYISMEHFSTMRYLMDKRSRFTHNNITTKFTPMGWNLKDITRNELLQYNTTLENDVWTKDTGTIVIDNSVELPSGSVSATRVETDTDNTIVAFEQDIDLKAYYNKKEFSGNMAFQTGEYTGNLKLVITDEHGVILLTNIIELTPELITTYFKFKLIIANGSKLNVRLESVDPLTTAGDGFTTNGISIWRNPVMVLAGYKSMDETTPNIFNDNWLKQYSTALIGMQWGENISKFAGVQLPGGVELDGDKIYDRYKTEKDELVERFQDEYEDPIDMVLA